MPGWFGYANQETFSKHYDNFQKDLREVTLRYGLKPVPDERLQALTIKALKNAGVLRHPALSKYDEDGICLSIRQNCLGSVYAQSAAAHIACVSVDAMPVPGAACHAAAFAYQYFAGNQCNDEYVKCKNEHQNP